MSLSRSAAGKHHRLPWSLESTWRGFVWHDLYGCHHLIGCHHLKMCPFQPRKDIARLSWTEASNRVPFTPSFDLEEDCSLIFP